MAKPMTTRGHPSGYWTTTGTSTCWTTSSDWRIYERGAQPLRLPKTWDGEIHLPDGAILHCQNGNYKIEDKDARITYQANGNRAFNPYVNASDMLEEFIRFLSTLQITQSQFMDIPIEVFINWLIMKAAQKDGDSIPEDIAVEEHPKLLAIAEKRPRRSRRSRK